MAAGQTGGSSTANWAASVAVTLLLGLWGSWLAWSAASPLGNGPTPRELPQEYILLTCSLLALYGAALMGGWLISRGRGVGRWKRSPLTVLSALVTGYGLIATAVFAISTSSEWSLAAVLPLALMASMHFHLFRSARGEAVPVPGDEPAEAVSGVD
ncbi:hypothetical protein HMPREF3086_02815 [Dietzia sp. HMSC21D01]|nr:hypothetical protein [Dietzia cinnamea]MCT2109921.1 hypothetical protein [Dietzia cinnamea]OFS26471.1 hypothetical protein HMPREF3086_02815 [Dietzia sp. HMSC21D01]